MKRHDKVLRIIYELSLLMAILLAIVAPIHANSTKHFMVRETLDENHAVFKDGANDVSVGDKVLIYRFNGLSSGSIGEARVEKTGSQDFTVAFESSDLTSPFGNHGTLIRDDGGNLTITLGSRLGIKPGQKLEVFDGRNWVGEVAVIKTENETAKVMGSLFSNRDGDLIVSEFNLPTQAVYFGDNFLSLIELVSIALLLFLYFFIYFDTRRFPLDIAGQYIRNIWRDLPSASIWWLINIVGGILFVLFAAKLYSYFFLYVTYLFVRVGSFSSLLLNLNTMLPYVYIFIASIYFIYLCIKKESPILAFWHYLSYKEMMDQNTTKNRTIMVWALSTIIVLTFSWTLTNYIVYNIQTIKSIGWPPQSTDALFFQMNVFVYILTILACMFGYAYSILCVLWGSRIRNVDFTLTGWLTNGLCYGFIFGFLIWKMVPPITGVDPIITTGPWFVFRLVLSLGLNILYMLTIVNMGKMFGLMTDKGVRSTGFFRIVRHPSYTLEAGMLFATYVNGLSSSYQWLAFLMFIVLLWLRSEREDNFMTYSNPEYQKYKLQTPFKFIPGVY